MKKKDLIAQAAAANSRSKERAFWLERLSGSLSFCHFPYDHKVRGELKCEEWQMQIADKTAKRLNHIANRSDMRLHVVLTASIQALLQKYSGDEDIILGIPIYKQEIEGEFITTVLTIRGSLNGGMSFRELTMQTRSEIMAVVEHANYPIESLLYQLGLPKPELDSFPLFDVTVLLRNLHDPAYLSNINNNLSFRFNRTAEQIDCKIVFNRNRYRVDTIERLSNHLQHFFSQALFDVEKSLNEIEILPPDEKDLILFHFNDTKRDYPADKTIHRCFAEQAKTTPDKAAVLFGGQVWSYSQLNERSTQLGCILKEYGIGRDSPVAILLERSPDMVTAILAIWKAGGAYVPLDRDYPAERIKFIIEDCGADVIIASENMRALVELSGIVEAVSVLYIDSMAEQLAAQSIELDSKVEMADLAYVIYTSGSTGTPKGVMVEHCGMTNHMYAKINDLKLNASTVVAQNASQTFDISVWQFFSALAVGGATVIYPDDVILDPSEFIAQLQRDKVRILEVVPSYLSVMLEFLALSDLSGLDYLMVTGEIVKPEVMRRWFELFPKVPVVNAYGPTEASDDITHHFMTEAPQSERVSVGKPVQNMRIYIVDDDMRLCPVGVKGEICVAGIGVGRGYVRQDEGTQQAFTIEPFRPGPRVRLYKTGDIGRWLPDGSIDFFGRKDYQVKIRGYRIELGEVESHLVAHREVREAIVLALIDTSGTDYLCGYLAPTSKLKLGELKNELARELPGYMVPSRFVLLDEFPRMPSGKIDRKALPKPSEQDGKDVVRLHQECVDHAKAAAEAAQQKTSDEQIDAYHEQLVVQSNAERSAIAGQTHRSGKPCYPLSYPQRMLYLHQKEFPQTGCQNLNYTILYDEVLDKALLERAINHVANESPGVRIRLVEIEHGHNIVPAQYVGEQHWIALDKADFTEHTNGGAIDSWHDYHNKKPFKLIDSDLYYFAYLKFDNCRSGYYMKLLHTNSDGWSTTLLASRIDEVYRALEQDEQLDNRQTKSYFDFVNAEETYLRSTASKSDMKFWHDYLIPLPEEVSLCSKPPATTDAQGEALTLETPNELREKINHFCEVQKSSLFKLFLATLSVYVARRTGVHDFVIGILNHNRAAGELHQTVGAFISFLPIRIKYDDRLTFDGWVEHVGNEVNRVLKDHSRLPFGAFVNQLRDRTGVDVRYFFNISLVGHPDLEELPYQIEHHFPGYEPTPLTIHLNFNNRNIAGVLELEWDYRRDRYDAEEIEGMHTDMCNLLQHALDNSGARIKDLEISAGGIAVGAVFTPQGRHTIEEVEECLSSHSDVEKAAIIRSPRRADKWLAFLQSDETLVEAELRDGLRERFGGGLNEIDLLNIAELPRDSDGHLDRTALRFSALSASETDAVLAIETPDGRKLAELWSQVLTTGTELSADANFFELGGNSLNTIILISKIEKTLHVKISLSEVFANPQLRDLAQLVDSKSKQRLIDIPKAPAKQSYKLSSAQNRLALLQRMHPESTVYNVSVAYDVSGDLEIAKLKVAVKKLIERHESLRTAIVMEDGDTVQKILPAEVVSAEVSVLDIDPVDTAECRRLAASFIQPFDLSKAPLFRVCVVRMSGESHLLILDIHHIITDGYSHQLLVKEFLALYDGHKLTEPSLAYRDYSEWEASALRNGSLEKTNVFWQQQLQNLPLALSLPLDKKRPSVRDFAGDRVVFKVPEDLLIKVRALARANETTLFTTLIAIFAAFLAKLCGQFDLMIGTPVLNRSHADLDSVVGLFANTLPLRFKLAPENSFAEFLLAAKRDNMAALENQHYPFDQMVEMSGATTDVSRNPLFDAFFNFIDLKTENNTGAAVPAAGLTARPWTEWLNQISKFDLTLETLEASDQLHCYFEYRSSLFERETVERFGRHFVHLLNQVVADPDKQIGDLTLLSSAERDRVIDEFNATHMAYPRDQSVRDLFESRVAENGEAAAVVFGSEALSYAELNARANQVARRLHARGVQPGSIVGLLVDRGIEMIVGIFGILKAGCAYLPLDSRYPSKRLSYMVADSECSLILTLGRYFDLAGELGEFLSLDDPSLYEGDAANLAVAIKPDDLAYVIYTSGSTGQPKGVLIEHGSLVNRLSWMQSRYPLRVGDTILQKTTYTFDVSVWELIWWSLAGARVSMLEPGVEGDAAELIKAIGRDQVTVMHFVPSMLTVFLNYLRASGDSSELSGLRRVFASGEALLSSHVRDFRELLTAIHGTALTNLYGPTEATIDVSYFDCDCDVATEWAPIGKPIWNTRFYILDEHNQPQPVGVAGELCIAGDNLARGYLKRPDLNREKFVDGLLPGERIYRTGDLARWLPDGNVAFLGRLDDQVKVRGFRIELGEVRARLLSHPEVRDAAVVSVGAATAASLCGYVVTEGKVSASTLRDYLSIELPDYMLPSYFVELEKLPLKPNGKLDRNALPAPEGSVESGVPYVAPRNDRERLLVEIWRDVLHVEKIGIDDNYFALGGDSIKAISMAARLRQHNLGVELRSLFQFPTVARLTPNLYEVQITAEQGPVVGDVPWAPIQKWFLDIAPVSFYHWNQAFVFEVRNADVAAIKQTFSQLLEHHDMLRATMSESADNGSGDAGFLTIVEPAAFEFDVHVFDLARHSNFLPEIAEQSSRLQASIDLRKGPLFKIALFKTSTKDYLLFVMHHLIIDGVSWRILLEDFLSLYTAFLKHEEPVLPAKTSSYKAWAASLARYSKPQKIDKEKAYWESVLDEIESTVVSDYKPDSDLHSDTAEIELRFGADETARLLNEAHRAYGTQIEDILLTALGLTCRKMFGTVKTAVMLEGHGREQIVADIDISRTIGWFTSVYPFVVQVPAESDIATSIKQNKERLRRVPNRGVGFLILKYLLQQGTAPLWRKCPEIGFNYLGQTGAASEESIFAAKQMDIGDLRALDSPRLYTLEINGAVTAGQLILKIEYNRQAFKRTTIERFASEFQANTRQLLEHCLSKAETEYTASDFSDDELSDADLDIIASEIGSIEG